MVPKIGFHTFMTIDIVIHVISRRTVVSLSEFFGGGVREFLPMINVFMKCEDSEGSEIGLMYYKSARSSEKQNRC